MKNVEKPTKSPYLIPHNAINVVESVIFLMKKFIKEENNNSHKKIDKKRKFIVKFNCLTHCDTKTVDAFKELESLYLKVFFKKSFTMPVSEKATKKKSNLNTKKTNSSYEHLLELEYQKKIKEFREKQEQELLKKIEDRKNGVVVGNEKTPSKIDPIIIEAYLEDFNSERSRFVLSVITANNIHLSFYNGVIKLINEDESFDEMYFTTIGNTLKFSNEKYSKDISINTLSIEKISDILLKQSSNKIFTDMILNCLSILHYINTFYNEKEKIEVSYEDIGAIKINKAEEKDINNPQSIVYLTKSKNKQTIRTIKIKKGKRKIDGTFLIRGHWRRQKYLTGAKLIWIEPFWKGVEKNKQRVYKIVKGNS